MPSFIARSWGGRVYSGAVRFPQSRVRLAQQSSAFLPARDVNPSTFAHASHKILKSHRRHRGLNMIDGTDDGNGPSYPPIPPAPLAPPAYEPDEPAVPAAPARPRRKA